MAVADSRIVELLDFAFKQRDVAAIVTIEQQIIRIFIAAGLAWSAVGIHYSQVGIYKCNRHGLGVSWSRMHRLGAKTWRLVFSWDAASQCVCFEYDDE